MALRNPKEDIKTPNLERLKPLQWHILECELVTPLYGGGVKAATVDLKMPIRASAIRGQLRFWWRLLAKHKWKLGNTKAIQSAEFSLFGGMGDDDGGRASHVFIKVNQPKVNEHDLMDWQDLNLPYVMFPASNERNSDITHQVLRTEKAKFQVSFAFSNQLQADQKRIQQVLEALRWWANFGGLGARSRKGLGAVHISESLNYPEINLPLTVEEVKAANCTVVFKGKSPNALTQLQMGIRKLSDFKQKAELGRNKGHPPKPAGRSRWPEPDALRRIHRTHHSNHAPEHQAGNVFPRALFGLPIIFHFVGAGEPKDSQLSPIKGDRLASPLFIRPFYIETDAKGQKQWSSCALVIPYDHIIKEMQVSIGGRESYPVWTEDTAQHIRPIQDYKGQDPLDAFLKYFAV